MDEAPALKVVLDPQYTDELRQAVMATITDAVADARQQTNIDSPWITGKKNIAKWLHISQASLIQLIAHNMPIHYLGDPDIWTANKHEMSEFLKQL